MDEELAVRLAEKEARRRANIEGWARSPQNANNIRANTVEAVLPEIAADPVNDDNLHYAKSCTV